MISIIIPAYNEEKAIVRTLKSLSPLRGRGFEIILSDALSADQTVTLAKPYVDKIASETDPRLRSG